MRGLQFAMRIQDHRSPNDATRVYVDARTFGIIQIVYDIDRDNPSMDGNVSSLAPFGIPFNAYAW